MILSNVFVRVAAAVPWNLRCALAMTNEERGKAFGMGLVLLTAWVIGIIFMVRYFKNAGKRREHEAEKRKRGRKK